MTRAKRSELEVTPITITLERSEPSVVRGFRARDGSERWGFESSARRARCTFMRTHKEMPNPEKSMRTHKNLLVVPEYMRTHNY